MAEKKIQYSTVYNLLKVLHALSVKGSLLSTEIAQITGLSSADVTRTLIPAMEKAFGFTLSCKTGDKNTGKPKRWRMKKEIRLDPIAIPSPAQAVLPQVITQDEAIILSCLIDMSQDLFGLDILQSTLATLHSKLEFIVDEGNFSFSDSNTKLLKHLFSLMQVYQGFRSNYPENIYQTIVSPLIEASIDMKTCKVDYDSFHASQRKTMEICPLRIMVFQGSMYCLCLDASKMNKVLSLEIGRFYQLEISDKTYNIPDDIDVDQVLSNSFGLFIDSPQHFEIAFDAEHAKFIRNKIWGNGQEIDETTDGGIILKLDTGGYNQIKHWVQTWGRGAKVIKPDSLREEIITEFKCALKNYEE